MSGLQVLGQTTLALIVVLAVICGLAMLIKKLTSFQFVDDTKIRVVSTTVVGPKERVVVVQLDDEWLVLGVAPGRVSMLDKRPAKVSESKSEKLDLLSHLKTSGFKFGADLSRAREKAKLINNSKNPTEHEPA